MLTLRHVGILILSGTLTACQAAAPPVMMSNKNAVELRAMETRIIPGEDRGRALRLVIATMQDLGYNIDTIHGATGTVSATKLSDLRLSTTVTPHGPHQVAIRADAEVRPDMRQFHQVDDPIFYRQDFFDPLEKAMLVKALPIAGDEPELKSISTPEPLYTKAHP